MPINVPLKAKQEAFSRLGVSVRDEDGCSAGQCNVSREDSLDGERGLQMSLTYQLGGIEGILLVKYPSRTLS